MDLRFAFIINPNSGKRKKYNVVDLITENFPKNIEKDFIIWKDKNDFVSVKKKIFEKKYTHIIAVGGDGTVNKVASCLIKSEMILGILPLGSGNGLARSLGVPMNIKDAILFLLKASNKKIDVGFINEEPFFCTAGVGFDARIGKLFLNSKKRGLLNYIKLISKELWLYRSKSYKISIENKVFHQKAFLITFANAGQYGNDFFIAPEANMNDGLLHVVFVKPFGFFGFFELMPKILRKKAHQSKYIETILLKNLKISLPIADVFHFDGEPSQDVIELDLSINASALKVLSN